MGATCISDFCDNEDQNNKEKKEEYNLSLRNITNEKPFNSSNKTNSLLITTTSKTRNRNNRLQEKASTNDFLEEDDIVNYKEKNKQIKENLSLSKIDNNRISNDYIEDKNWKNFDVSFLVDIFSYNSKNDDEIIYQTELNLLNQNIFFIETNMKDTLTLGSKEVHFIITKYKFEIYKFNSVTSSLSFALSNDSKSNEIYSKSNFNSNKIKLKINNNDSIIYSIYFYDFNLVLKKYDFCPKNNIILNNLYSIAQIEYCNKNNLEEEKNNIILSTSNPNKLNYILKLISLLSSFCK